MEDYIKINACPICGRRPKVHFEHFACYGWQVTLQCKPFLRKRHFIARAQHPSRGRCLQIAIENWNKETDI